MIDSKATLAVTVCLCVAVALPAGSALAASPSAVFNGKRVATEPSALPQLSRAELLRIVNANRNRNIGSAVRGGVCGNSLADTGEQCDDGNTANGDGCSDVCEVEDGFVCTDPVPPFSNNIANPGFEDGLPTTDWTQTGTLFDPICSGQTCLGDPHTSLGFDGDWWAWFGGASSPNLQTLTQTLTIPADAPTLTFELQIGACDSTNDTLNVSIDGNAVYNRVCDGVSAQYQSQSVDLTDALLGGPYNDGASHTLVMTGNTLATNLGNSNFFVDRLQINSPAPPIPSLCQAIPCGNVVLDAGEQCDDGNTADGDGCSAFCQIEEGFDCTLPVPGMSNGDIIGDGGFELPGVNTQMINPFWAESGTVFTPVCDAAACSVFLGNEGQGFAWFGGADTPNSQSLQQVITIPVEVTSFDFGLLVAGGGAGSSCDGPDDSLRILIDGNIVFQTPDPCLPSGGSIGSYPVNTVDLSAGGYNDGGSHVLRIEGDTFSVNGGNTNFLLDSLTGPFALDPPIPPVPSQCAAMPETCYIEDFDEAGAGDLTGWTRFNDGAVVADWGTTDDGICGSNNVGAGNFSGGAGEAACIDSDAVSADAINAYLCSPPIALNGTASTLKFLYNYHPFLAPAADDAFEVLVGTDAPSLAGIASYTSLFFTNAEQGTLIGLPGASQSLDISAFEGSTAHVCFRYGGNFDWYAHVDDVAISAQTCFADSDGDGVTDFVDNCTHVANPLQTDSNGDGIGNQCDADIAGAGGPGLDDCTVNFFDLGRMREVFFSSDPHADLVGENNTAPDGVVNFFDLGRMKETFFAPPGPSAAGCN